MRVDIFVCVEQCVHVKTSSKYIFDPQMKIKKDYFGKDFYFSEIHATFLRQNNGFSLIQVHVYPPVSCLFFSAICFNYLVSTLTFIWTKLHLPIVCMRFLVPTCASDASVKLRNIMIKFLNYFEYNLYGTIQENRLRSS